MKIPVVENILSHRQCSLSQAVKDYLLIFHVLAYFEGSPAYQNPDIHERAVKNDILLNKIKLRCRELCTSANFEQ